MKVIHYGTNPMLKYIKIIYDITRYGKSPIMSRMKNALHSPACAQPLSPSELLKIIWEDRNKT